MFWSHEILREYILLNNRSQIARSEKVNWRKVDYLWILLMAWFNAEESGLTFLACAFCQCTLNQFWAYNFRYNIATIDIIWFYPTRHWVLDFHSWTHPDVRIAFPPCFLGRCHYRFAINLQCICANVHTSAVRPLGCMVGMGLFLWCQSPSLCSVSSS